jgi:hypothetical protein
MAISGGRNQDIGDQITVVLTDGRGAFPSESLIHGHVVPLTNPVGAATAIDYEDHDAHFDGQSDSAACPLGYVITGIDSVFHDHNHATTGQKIVEHGIDFLGDAGHHSASHTINPGADFNFAKFLHFDCHSSNHNECYYCRNFPRDGTGRCEVDLVSDSEMAENMGDRDIAFTCGKLLPAVPSSRLVQASVASVADSGGMKCPGNSFMTGISTSYAHHEETGASHGAVSHKRSFTFQCAEFSVARARCDQTADCAGNERCEQGLWDTSCIAN